MNHDQSYNRFAPYKWEVVELEEDFVTERLRVPGGWIYRIGSTHGVGTAPVVFVPLVLLWPT